MWKKRPWLGGASTQSDGNSISIGARWQKFFQHKETQVKCHIPRAKENRGTVSGIIIKRCTNKTEFIICRSFRFNCATPTFPAVIGNAEFSYTPLKDSHISSRFLASLFVAVPA
jgi:hypothetical protein